MTKEEILEFLSNRLSELKKKKSILSYSRIKNKGKIEEIEFIMSKISSGDLKDDSDV